MSWRRPNLAVAVPARNEAALIGRCLDALAAQQNPGDFCVIVLVNGCTDDTASIAAQPRGLDMRVIETDLPADRQGAGHARRAAMAAAAQLGDIILTTDADCVADRDWIAAHRAAFAKGVDAVAGRVSGDWSELQRLPPRALEIGALEWEYLDLLAQAEAKFDPRPHDPAPRHAQCCGANIGITASMLARVGGVPPLATGEDRALIDAVGAVGGLVRHDPAPHVTASARTLGRATGGMADALAARMTSGYRCDAQFEPVARLKAKWAARQAARPFDAAPADLLRPEELPAQIVQLRQLIEANG